MSTTGSEADRDAAFSEELCKELDIPFKTVRINAAEEAREAGISVEEAGRRARYRILEAEALLWEKDGRNHVHIATAHHGNDSAETAGQGQDYPPDSVGAAPGDTGLAPGAWISVCGGFHQQRDRLYEKPDPE